MKHVFKSKQSPAQQLKAITDEDMPLILKWFDDQRFEHHWCFTLEEQLASLGNISLSLYSSWLAQIKSGGAPVLNYDATRRLSILVGINKSLEILAPDNRPDCAVRWLLTPNNSAICAGQSIKTYLLINNTLNGFCIVEAYLVDAVNGFLGGTYS